MSIHGEDATLIGLPACASDSVLMIDAILIGIWAIWGVSTPFGVSSHSEAKRKGTIKI